MKNTLETVLVHAHYSHFQTYASRFSNGIFCGKTFLLRLGDNFHFPPNIKSNFLCIFNTTATSACEKPHWWPFLTIQVRSISVARSKRRDFERRKKQRFLISFFGWFFDSVFSESLVPSQTFYLYLASKPLFQVNQWKHIEKTKVLKNTILVPLQITSIM